MAPGGSSGKPAQRSGGPGGALTAHPKGCVSALEAGFFPLCGAGGRAAHGTPGRRAGFEPSWDWAVVSPLTREPQRSELVHMPFETASALQNGHSSAGRVRFACVVRRRSSRPACEAAQPPFCRLEVALRLDEPPWQRGHTCARVVKGCLCFYAHKRTAGQRSSCLQLPAGFAHEAGSCLVVREKLLSEAAGRASARLQAGPTWSLAGKGGPSLAIRPAACRCRGETKGQKMMAQRLGT